MDKKRSKISADSNEGRQFLAFLRHNPSRAFDTLDTNPTGYINVALEAAAESDEKLGSIIGKALLDYLAGRSSDEVKTHLFNQIPTDSRHLKPVAIQVGRGLLLGPKARRESVQWEKRAELLLRLADFYGQSKDLARCIRCSKYALRYLRLQRKPSNTQAKSLVRALSMMATCTRELGRFSESIAFAAEALSIANSVQDGLESSLRAMEARLWYCDSIAASLDLQGALAEYRKLNQELKDQLASGKFYAESFLMLSHVRLAGIHIRLKEAAEAFFQIEQANAQLEQMRTQNPQLAEIFCKDVRLVYTNIKAMIGLELQHDGFCDKGIGLLERMALENPREFLFEYACSLYLITNLHDEKLSKEEKLQFIQRSKDAAVGVDLHCRDEDPFEMAKLFLGLTYGLFFHCEWTEALDCARRAARYASQLESNNEMNRTLSADIREMDVLLSMTVDANKKKAIVQQPPKEPGADESSASMQISA